MLIEQGIKNENSHPKSLMEIVIKINWTKDIVKTKILILNIQFLQNLISKIQAKTKL